MSGLQGPCEDAVGKCDIESMALKYYRRLFSSSVTLSAIDIAIALTSIYVALGFNVEDMLNYITGPLIVTLLSLVPVLGALSLTPLCHKNRGRRLLTLLSLIIMLSCLCDSALFVAKRLAGTCDGVEHVGVASSAVPLTLIGFYVLGLSDPLILALGIAPSAIDILMSMTLGINTPTSTLAIALAACLITLGYCKWLNVDVNGVSSAGLARGFAANWLTGDPKGLEELLLKLSEPTSGWVKCFVAREPSGRILLVLLQTSFHTGPFRNVGSSKLVNELVDAVEREFNCTAAVLHGPGDHTLDIASSTDVERVLRASISAVSSAQEVVSINGIVERRGEDYEVMCLNSPEVPIVIVTNRRGSDDVPYWVYDESLRIARAVGFKDIMVVESHSIKPEGGLDVENLKELMDLVSRVLEEASKYGDLNDSELSVGVAKDRSLAVRDDICEQGVTIIVLDVRGTRVCLVVIDGNNMVPGLRDAIIRRLKELGANVVEVVTTDNHSKTALRPGKHAYLPVGAVTSVEELLSVIESLFAEATQRMVRCRLLYGEHRVENVKVLGSKGLDKLMEVLEVVGSRALRTLPLLFTTPIALVAVSALLDLL